MSRIICPKEYEMYFSVVMEASRVIDPRQIFENLMVRAKSQRLDLSITYNVQRDEFLISREFDTVPEIKNESEYSDYIEIANTITDTDATKDDHSLNKLYHCITDRIGDYEDKKDGEKV